MARAHSVFTVLLSFAGFGLALAMVEAEGRAHVARGQNGIMLLAALAAFYAAVLVNVFFHEGAHAACARACGFTVTHVRIGRGRAVYQRRLGNAIFSIHASPFGGSTGWRPGGTLVTRTKRAVVTLAGPLANLAVAGICWVARGYAPVILIPAACANALVFIVNVLPCPQGSKRDLPDDGWQLLQALFNTYWIRTLNGRMDLQERCQALERANRPSDAIRLLRQEIDQAEGDHPDAEAMLCARLLSYRRSGKEVDEGFQRSGRLFYDRRAHPVFRATALNGRAYMLALGGWPHLMPEAEWAVRDALLRYPQQVDMRETLALILVRLGRFDEAEPIAKSVLEELRRITPLARGAELGRLESGIAGTCCTLALLYAHTGRREEAIGEMLEARAQDPAYPLLSEVHELLYGARASTTADPRHGGCPRAALSPVAPAPAHAGGHAELTAPTQLPTPVRRGWAVPMLVEAAAGALLLAAVLCLLALAHPPTRFPDGVAVRFQVDMKRAVGQLGLLAVLVAGLSATALAVLRQPRTGARPLSKIRRRLAQCIPAAQLMVITPALVAFTVTSYTSTKPPTGAYQAVLITAAGIVIAADAAAVRLLSKGPLRIHAREFLSLFGWGTWALLAPLLLAGWLWPSSAASGRHVAWHYLWVAAPPQQAAGLPNLERTIDGLACPQAGACAVLISARGVSGQDETLKLARTTDGGAHWSVLGLPAGEARNLSGAGISCTRRWQCVVTTGAAQTVLDTPEGSNWIASHVPGSDFDGAPVCPAASQCYGVSEDRIKHSSDGGATWTSSPALPGTAGVEEPLNGIGCLSASVCAAYGTDGHGALVDVTTDGGRTWVRRGSDSRLQSVLAMSCPDARTCYALAYAPARPGARPSSPSVPLVLSSDGLGGPWTVLDVLPNRSWALSINCADRVHCLIVGAIAGDRTNAEPTPPPLVATVTGNAGRTWVQRAIPYSGTPSYGTLSCADTRRCAFAAQAPSGPMLISTLDAGQTWTGRPIP
ncbi:MAG: site-2 protease family protein [Solirubrobacteraceae bacterium]